jgi:hypothetical protein
VCGISHAQATAQAFLDGYMQTGDIFEQRGPAEIHWIDRRGNVMKLSQVQSTLSDRCCCCCVVNERQGHICSSRPQGW